jgi:hypothetical protein
MDYYGLIDSAIILITQGDLPLLRGRICVEFLSFRTAASAWV